MAEQEGNAAILDRFLKENDPPSYLGVRALVALKGQRVDAHREDILRFLVHRYGKVPLAAYLQRLGHLRELQARFQKTGAYEASSYADVPAIDGESYRIALLLSFILTNHRFEILEALEEFLRSTSGSEPQELLSIGFGTGYELKVASSILPEWRYSAYDTSPESLEYASDLLALFGCPTVGLRTEAFPLETPELPAEHRERYGKIVLCELLEHLEDPEAALRSMRAALHPQGMVFATMAINIAQEDHVFLYRCREDAREQVVRAGFTILREFVTPATVIPFAEKNRDRIFTKGNYVCFLGVG
jgi:SAM-dependent methyltransferase